MKTTLTGDQISAYMPVGSTFNGQQNILPDDYFKSLQKGDVLDNDDWNPIVHQQNGKAP